MPKPISAAMRQRFEEQRAAMSNREILDMKSLVDVTFRCLPVDPERLVPGYEYLQIYSGTLKKGTSSPQAWGLPCKVLEAADRGWTTPPRPRRNENCAMTPSVISRGRFGSAAWFKVIWGRSSARAFTSCPAVARLICRL